jgi:hypothetical protein
MVVVSLQAKDEQPDGGTDGQTDWQRTDGQMEMTKLIVAFRNFTNAFNVSSYGQTSRNLN